MGYQPDDHTQKHLRKEHVIHCVRGTGAARRSTVQKELALPDVKPSPIEYVVYRFVYLKSSMGWLAFEIRPPQAPWTPIRQESGFTALQVGSSTYICQKASHGMRRWKWLGRLADVANNRKKRESEARP